MTSPPQGLYVAGGSTTGTLSVCNVSTAQRNTPEPSFLYHWLSTHELKASAYLYARLSAMYPYLHNVQVCGLGLDKCVMMQGAILRNGL